MDWQSIKAAICEGRHFTVADQECHVLSDVIMPSGGAIRVHIQPRMDFLYLHDGGAAFDELARHGIVTRSLRGVQAMMRETNFRMDSDGLIWRDRVPLERVAVGVALLADASYRAVTYMMARAPMRSAEPLDQRVKSTLHHRYPAGRPNFTFQGKNRQHTFDFGLTVDDRTILVEAVTPDSSSVAAAIVKALDAKEASPNVTPLFVFDPADHWASGNLNMLKLGGKGVEIGADLLAA